MNNKQASNTPLIDDAVAITNPGGSGNFILVCEHASNFIPLALNNLGLDEELRLSHISWDPGALAVAKRLSLILDAPLISACVSRLVYDCNRPPSAPDAIAAFSEIHSIPGNQNLSDTQRQQRITQIYQPFHAALSELIERRCTNNSSPAFVTIHSFVPVYKGIKRDVEIGILHDSDHRLADYMLNQADGNKAFEMHRNQPYGPDDGVTHSLKEHALPNGLINVMIEIRNDLINDPTGQQRLAEYLSRQLKQAETLLSVANEKD